MALTTERQVSEEIYRQLALGNSRLELHRGLLREKPGMSVEHNDIADLLATLLRAQLERRQYRVRENLARLQLSSHTYYVPDIVVIPTAMVQALRERPGSLDTYREPMPLVIEIWSPSTGDYDLNEKLGGYQQRGDLEISYVHPYERTLTAWHKEADGAYSRTTYHDGIAHPTSLPGVAIDLDTLFAP
jgi:Uma2 family endonuclease